jgi:hypothetical protein
MPSWQLCGGKEIGCIGLGICLCFVRLLITLIVIESRTSQSLMWTTLWFVFILSFCFCLFVPLALISVLRFCSFFGRKNVLLMV